MYQYSFKKPDRETSSSSVKHVHPKGNVKTASHRQMLL